MSQCGRCQGRGFVNPLKVIKEGVSRAYHSIVGRNGAPPKIRELIKNHGSAKIVEISVCRKPIDSIIDKAIDIFSFGKWAEVKKKYGYDDMFHLYMIFKLDDGKFVQLEKNGVVETKYVHSIDQHSGMDVSTHKGVTIGQLFENAEKKIGKSLWLYRAADNHCQRFITNLLRCSGLLTNELNRYINQNVESIVSGLPEFAQKIINTATDMSAAADVLINGKGLKRRQRKKRYKLI
jgi:hypothetical protein